jgi:hypothetical protein
MRIVEVHRHPEHGPPDIAARLARAATGFAVTVRARMRYRLCFLRPQAIDHIPGSTHRHRQAIRAHVWRRDKHGCGERARMKLATSPAPGHPWATDLMDRGVGFRLAERIGKGHRGRRCGRRGLSPDDVLHNGRQAIPRVVDLLTRKCHSIPPCEMNQECRLRRSGSAMPTFNQGHCGSSRTSWNRSGALGEALARGPGCRPGSSCRSRS